MARKMRTYTEEFRRAAVERVDKGEQRVKVAQDLDISPSLIDTWRRKIKNGEGFTDRKTYDEDFKKAAVARIGPNETLSAVAAGLGITGSMLSEWRKKMATGKANTHERVKKHSSERRTYDDAFKRKAVARVHKGELQMTVAKDLGVHHTLISNWMKGGQGAPKGKGPPPAKKKSYYVKVADRVPGLYNAATDGETDSDKISRRRALAIQSCVAMLRKLQPQINVNDPVHLTAALVLATLEGKM